MEISTTPSSFWDHDGIIINNTHNDPTVLAEIQAKLRSSNHGFGGFSDSLLHNVCIRSYDEGSNQYQHNNHNHKYKNDTTIRLSSLPHRHRRRRPCRRPPSLVLSFVVTKDLCNAFDTLHGGAQATAIDVFTSLLLAIIHNDNQFPSVTTDLHVSCVAAAPLGSTVFCVCQADKHNGALHFASCELYKEVTITTNTNTNDNNSSSSSSSSSSKKENKKGTKQWVLVAKGRHTKYVLKKPREKGFGGEEQRSLPLPRSKL